MAFEICLVDVQLVYPQVGDGGSGNGEMFLDICQSLVEVSDRIELSGSDPVLHTLCYTISGSASSAASLSVPLTLKKLKHCDILTLFKRFKE